MNTSPLRRHRTLLAVALVVFLAFGGWLAFGYFGIQALVVDDKVSAALPSFAVASSVTPAADPAPTAAPEPIGSATSPPTTAATAATTIAPTTVPAVVATHSGRFVARSHPSKGTATVLGNGTAQRFLRFEDDFATDNGPDLNVYLSTASPDAPASRFDDDYIDLGDLNGNVGSQNYEIPEGVDLSRYRTAVVWCVRFGVAFGVVDLRPT